MAFFTFSRGSLGAEFHSNFHKGGRVTSLFVFVRPSLILFTSWTFLIVMVVVVHRHYPVDLHDEGSRADRRAVCLFGRREKILHPNFSFL